MGLFSFNKKKSVPSGSSQSSNISNINDLPPIPTISDPSTVSTLNSSENQKAFDAKLEPSLDSPTLSSESTSLETPSSETPSSAPLFEDPIVTSSKESSSQDFDELLDAQTLDNGAEPESDVSSSDFPRFEESSHDSLQPTPEASDLASFDESEFDFHDLFIEQEKYVEAITGLKRTKHDFERRFAENTMDFIQPNEKTGRLLKKMKANFMKFNKNLLIIDSKLAKSKM